MVECWEEERNEAELVDSFFPSSHPPQTLVLKLYRWACDKLAFSPCAKIKYSLIICKLYVNIVSEKVPCILNVFKYAMLVWEGGWKV